MELAGSVVSGDSRPWWVSFTLDDRPERAGDPRLRSGEPVHEAVTAAAGSGAAAVLFNCCQPEVVAPALAVAARAVRARPAAVAIGAYANAFAPQPTDARANAELSAVRTDLDPPRYLEYAREWLTQGASVVGGCCGVGPEHIALLHQRLRDAPRSAAQP